MKEKKYKCISCGESKASSFFYSDSGRWQKVQSRCILCDKKRYKERRRSYFIEYMGKNRVEHKEKWIARAEVRKAILRKEIIKPNKCETCGKAKKLEAHHDNYTEPLNVIFLCSICHLKADNLRLEK